MASDRKAYAADWRARHREKLRERAKAWNKSPKGKAARRRYQNSPKGKAARRRYQETHPDFKDLLEVINQPPPEPDEHDLTAADFKIIARF